MKKLLIILVVFASCNSPKDPPDDGLWEKLRVEQAKRDSINNIASIKTKPQ